MKKTLLTVATILAFSILSFAQTPEKIQYQAVARNSSGSIIANQLVGYQISILQGSANGTSVYTETHIGLTNGYGLLNLQIGNGTVVSGSMSSIDWSSNIHFVKIEMDATGGSNYQLMGTSELLSVPYALNAKTADNVFSGDYNDLTNQPTIITSADDADADATNEIQSLTLSGSTLTLSNGGGTVTLPSGGGGTNLSSYTNDVGFITSPNDADSDATNEIQSLTLSGSTLTLSNGGGAVTLPSGGASGIVVIDNSNYTSVTTGIDDIINIQGTVNISANYSKLDRDGSSISGGEFIGTGTQEIDFGRQSVISGVKFENLKLDAHDETIFINCEFTNVTTFGFDAIFQGCHFNNCSDPTGRIGHFTNCEIDNSTFKRVQFIDNCEIDNCTFGGDYISSPNEFRIYSITNCVIDDSKIYLQGNFIGNRTDGLTLYLFKYGRQTVTGNYFDDAFPGLNEHIIINMNGTSITDINISGNVFDDSNASAYVNIIGSFTGNYNLIKVSNNNFIRGQVINNSGSGINLIVTNNATKNATIGVSNGGTTIVRDNDSF